jgi:hypothetical protein
MAFKGGKDVDEQAVDQLEADTLTIGSFLNGFKEDVLVLVRKYLTVGFFIKFVKVCTTLIQLLDSLNPGCGAHYRLRLSRLCVSPSVSCSSPCFKVRTIGVCLPSRHVCCLPCSMLGAVRRDKLNVQACAAAVHLPTTPLTPVFNSLSLLPWTQVLALTDLMPSCPAHRPYN